MKKQQFKSSKVLRFLCKESLLEPTFWLCLVLIPLSSVALNSAIPLLISRILSKLAQHTTHSFTPFFVALVAVGFIGIICNRIGFGILMKSQAKTTERVSNTVMENLFRRGQTFYANQMTGKLVSDVIALDGSIIHFQDVFAIQILPFLAVILTGVTVIFITSWKIGLLISAITLFVIGSAIWNSKQRAPIRNAKITARRDVHGNLADGIINNQSITIFARENQELQRHQKLNAVFTKTRITDWSRLNRDGNNRIIGVIILQLLFVWTLVHAVTQNYSLLPTAIFAFSFVLTVTNRMFDIGAIIRTLEDSIHDAAPVIRILEKSLDVQDAVNASELHVQSGAIKIQNLDFAYHDSNQQKSVFADLNLSVAAGQKVALVGHSGSGKSTLVKLLLRLSDIDGGAITIDGQDIATVTQQSLREAIGYVPQDPALFHRSIRDNISYGATEYSEAAIMTAAKAAHAHEFISQLPDGYNTLVGERGVKLSGGQRQRIAIARAMLKDAPILILDEATSALDSESEVLIQQALWKLMEGRTAIVIAHRLSTIQKMDRIIVLEDGRIVEDASHKQLVNKKNGIYAKLWAHQSGGFIED